jgi:glyoxylase-like metal-dependent hydrolase (beta-lactamase superfamily II)
MRLTLSTAALVLLACSDHPPAEVMPVPVVTLLGQAIASVGDATALAGLKGLSVDASGTSSSYDEGLDPGPGVIPVASSEFKVATSIDIDNERLRLAQDRTYLLLRPGTAAKFNEILAGNVGYVVGDDRVTGGPGGYLARLSAARAASTRRQQAMLDPHLLIRRLMEADVTDGGMVNLNGRAQHRLTVQDPDKISPIDLLVDAASGRLSALVARESDPLRGDVAVRVLYDRWEPSGGLFFSHHLSIDVEGQPVRVEDRSAIIVNPSFASDLFALPGPETPVPDPLDAERGQRSAQSYQRFVAMGVGAANEFPHDTVAGVEIGAGSGVYHLVGATHHSLLVVAPGKTVVLVDAPNDAGRSKAILAWIERTLPGGLPANRLSHVILTHHHADHSSGLRTFVARGATPVVGEESRALWAKVLLAPRTIDPDEQSGKTASPALTTVKPGESLSLGNVTAYHIASTHAADMLVVRVTSPGNPPVLFVTDIYNPSTAGILPKSTFVAWARELDEALVGLGLDDPATVILGGHGNVDETGNHFTVSYSTFKAQLGAAQ